MLIAIAIVCGLVWGLLFALLGGLILRRAIVKNTNGAVMAANLLRTVVDLTALGLIYLARDILPFDWRWMMVAAAVALSVGLIVISFRIAKSK